MTTSAGTPEKQIPAGRAASPKHGERLGARMKISSAGRRSKLIVPLRLGSLRLPFNLLAAPMAGFTDRFFRDTVRSFGGVGLLYAEMVSAEELLRRPDGGLPERLEGLREELGDSIPLGVQLWDNDPDVLADAAQRVLECFKPSHIGLNFGCPCRRVVKHGCGARLLLFPDKVRRIVEAVAEKINVPLAVKVRLGIVSGQPVVFDVLSAVEDGGAAWITVHGRYEQQRFKGKADWEAIARVKEKARIPVIGNGDIREPDDILRVLRVYGVDGVMAARGLLRRPWLFRDAVALDAGESLPPPPGPGEQRRLLEKHFQMLFDRQGEKEACKRIRRIAPKYGFGTVGVRAFRGKISGVRNAAEFREIMREFFPGADVETENGTGIQG